MKRASYSELKKRVSGGVLRAFPSCLHSKGQPLHKKRTVKKEGVGGVWELQGEGPSAVAKETADSMPRFS